eukprot:scaffold1.g5788.t1
MSVPVAAPSLAAGSTTVDPSHPSVNTSSPCYSSPSSADCATFERTGADWSSDLVSACGTAPALAGCAMWAICKARVNTAGPHSRNGTAPRCAAWIKGCEAYAGLCASGSAVAQCASPGPVPKLVTTKVAREQALSICDEMPDMDDCVSCNATSCPSPLLTYGRLCYSMPSHTQCAAVLALCADPDVASTFGEVCRGKSPTAAPAPAAAPAAAPSAGAAGGGSGANSTTRAAGSATVDPSQPSVNTSSPCYSSPSSADCAAFTRTDADWSSDLAKLCTSMPYMSGCSLWALCQAQGSSAGYCQPASLVGDVCKGDPAMSKMKGCEAYTGLCAEGSAVAQCGAAPPAPGLVTTYAAKDAIDSICAEMYMTDCDSCSEAGRRFAKCADPLLTLGRLCYAMPQMWQCSAASKFGQDWESFCGAPDVSSTFPQVCSGADAGTATGSTLPPMKMYMHQSAREIMLFKEWVPQSTGAYVGACFGFLFLAGLKAVRLRVEMAWGQRIAAQLRRPCPGCGPGEPAKLKGLGPAPACCEAGQAEAGQGKRRRRRGWWADVEEACAAYMTTSQARRNAVRSAFTFVVVFVDYMLMLVVMTFNVMIIVSVVAGFAIGSFLFGHVGEPSPAQMKNDEPEPLQARERGEGEREERDIETPYVMAGGDCCNAGMGCNPSQA